MQGVALGPSTPHWVKKYAAENLRFVEYERKALPCALLRKTDDSSRSSSKAGKRGKDGKDGKEAEPEPEPEAEYSFCTADMDARSVMEQRMQSLVCCFSMVQRVIDANRQHLEIAKKDSSDQKQQQQADCAVPLVPCLPGAAVEQVWARLQEVPPLMEKHLLAPAVASAKAAASAAATKRAALALRAEQQQQQHLASKKSPSKSSPSKASTKSHSQQQTTNGSKSPLKSSPCKSSLSSPTKSQTKSPYRSPSKATMKSEIAVEAIASGAAGYDGASTAAAVAVGSAAPMLVDAAAEKLSQSRAAAVEAIRTCLGEVRALLAPECKPRGLTKLRAVCLDIRTSLQKIEHTATSKARIGLLADLLVLWAFTSNFSTVQHFDAVESGPITVCARELGTNIPRNKVSKMLSRGASSDPSQRRREKGKDLEQAALSAVANGAADGGVGEDEALPSVLHPISSSEDAVGVGGLHGKCSSSSSSLSTSTNGENDLAAPDLAPLTGLPVNTDAVDDVKENQQQQRQQESYYLSPNEPVFVGTMQYSQQFTFWQVYLQMQHFSFSFAHTYNIVFYISSERWMEHFA